MRTKTLVLLLSLIMVAVVSRADSAEIVMGAVKAISANSITLETIGKAPKSVVVTVLPSTRFVKDGADASMKDLKLDDRVVVSVKANGDKFEAVRVFVFRDFLCSMYRGQPDFPGAHHGAISARTAARFPVAHVERLFLGAGRSIRIRLVRDTDLGSDL